MCPGPPLKRVLHQNTHHGWESGEGWSNPKSQPGQKERSEADRVTEGHHGGSAGPVSTHRSGVGLTGSSQTVFYAEVTDAQRGGPGGGLVDEGELIEVVHLPLDSAQAFVNNMDVPKTLGVIFGISWFLGQIAPRLGLQ